MELFLTGDTFDAVKGAQIGLLNAAVSEDKLDETVAAYTGSILRGAPNALWGCKRLVREVPGMTMDDAFAQTAAWSADYFTSEEAREGLLSFAEKRPPRWAEAPDD
jgi:methylglutaconyl-CoA hydratase